MKFDTSPGEPYPLGANVVADGVNFSLFSRNATAVELLLFNHFGEPPAAILPLNPHFNKTFHYWHIHVHEIGEGQIYAFRVDGPFEPSQGHRFNHKKVLLDPYSRGVVYGKNWSREEAKSSDDNLFSAMKSLVVDPAHYEWEGAKAPNYHLSDSIIYELHVKGFTRHKSSGTRHPGTFDALIEKIPYLKELGITAVELLPIHQFDPNENPNKNPETGEQLTNYWGYNSICFFAPHRGYYKEDWEEMVYLTSFRDLIKAFHKNGLEVILDVVFNHTSEAEDSGPTLSFRGLENCIYYMLDPEDRSKYMNYSGCGNTMNCNHPLVRRLILESLRYWVSVMHVDGFRFDLASILSRDEDGRPMKEPPLLWEIESDPVLSHAKIIAEAWDAAGLYQVGGFPGERWAEWNGKYRDDIRRFIRGDQGMVGALASRISGSGDLYQHLGRRPYQSINYITCHDGFTLNDLVSYTTKRNLANGENNRDGQDENFSFNHGAEGETKDPYVNQFRERQIKNYFAILLLSQGTPMILAGDEMRRTQNGNNNAYCQDNEISWLDWNDLKKHQDIFRFVKKMIEFRKAHAALRSREYFWGLKNRQGWTELTWHGIKLNQPDWNHYSHTLALTLAGFDLDDDIHIVMNGYTEALSFELPVLPADKNWKRVIDTSLPSPQDILEESKLVEQHDYLASPHSVLVFISG